MQRIGVLNGNNITYDHDLAGLVRGLTDGGVIQGGEISENKVQPVQAVIACQRSNGQKLMLYFESDEQVQIASSGNFKVYIEVNQAKIDDGSANAENGSGIAQILSGPNLPSKNALLLATVENGQVRDQRAIIPKIQSVAQRTSTLEQKMETAENNIAVLQDKGTPQYLGKRCVVGESYQSGDIMVEKDGVLVKFYKEITYTTTIPRSFIGKYFVGRFDVPKGEEILIDLRINLFTSSGTFEKVVVISNKEYSSLQDYKNNPGIVYATAGENGGIMSFVKNDDTPVYITLFCSSPYETYPTEGERSIKFEIFNGKELPKLHPREVKGVGERVECTLFGVHSDGKFIGRGAKIKLNQTIEGDASAIRTAPCNGLLEVEYVCYEGKAHINGVNLARISTGTVYHCAAGRGLIYVDKGDVNISTGVSRYNSGTYNSKIALTGFIPL